MIIQWNCFLDNVWLEIEDEIIVLACYKDSNRLIEQLIWENTLAHLGKLVVVLSRFGTRHVGLVELATSPYGSYVYDTLLRKVLDCSREDEEGAVTIMTEICKIFINLSRSETLELVTCMTGSFVLRHTLQAMTGELPEQFDDRFIPFAKFRKLSKTFVSQFIEKIDRPPETKLEQHAKVLSVYSLTFNTHGALVLSDIIAICVRLKFVNIIELFLDSLLVPNPATADGNTETSETRIYKLTRVQKPSRVFGELIEGLSRDFPERFLAIYETSYRGKLVELSKHLFANFIVQKLVCNLPKDSNELLESIVTELGPHFMEIIESGRMPVLYALLKAGATSHEKLQGQLLQHLVDAVQPKDTDSTSTSMADKKRGLAKIILFLKNVPKHNGKKKKEETFVFSPLSQLGCRMLNTLLEYDPKHSAEIVKGFVHGVDVDTLVLVCTDKVGSKVVDAIMESEKIQHTHKVALAERLQGHYSKLAISTYGSFCVEKFYTKLDMKYKEKIVSELASVDEELTKLSHGPIIIKKFKLNIYMMNRTAWVRMEELEEINEGKMNRFFETKKDIKRKLVNESKRSFEPNYQANKIKEQQLDEKESASSMMEVKKTRPQTPKQVIQPEEQEEQVQLPEVQHVGKKRKRRSKNA